jgi:transcriptional regulator with XRE-family HTH domain
MATPEKARTTFGDQLRGQLDQHPRIKSARALSRVMSQDRPENARRMLQKWINGEARPTLASRVAVADALGIDPAAFASEDDDEEAAQMREAFRLFTDLMAHLGELNKERVTA